MTDDEWRRTVVRLLVMMGALVGYAVGVITTRFHVPAYWSAPLLIGYMVYATRIRGRRSSSDSERPLPKSDDYPDRWE